MHARWLSITFVLGAAGCVGDSDAGDDIQPVLDDGHASISAAVETPDDGYDICEHLPAEPPCSLICDREALDQYVPESSCAVFVCTLTDGNQISVHACHPRE